MIKNSTAAVEQEKRRLRLTLEALADVDAGRVIDQRAVQAWANSLGPWQDGRETDVLKGKSSS
jgi:hypothetical protein